MLHSAGSAIFLAAGTAGRAPLPASQSWGKRPEPRGRGREKQKVRAPQRCASRQRRAARPKRYSPQPGPKFTSAPSWRPWRRRPQRLSALRRLPRRPPQAAGTGERLLLFFSGGRAGAYGSAHYPVPAARRLPGQLTLAPSKGLSAQPGSKLGGREEHCAGAGRRPAANPSPRRAAGYGWLHLGCWFRASDPMFPLVEYRRGCCRIPQNAGRFTYLFLGRSLF